MPKPLLNVYSTDDLIRWRDTASFRAGDREMTNLEYSRIITRNDKLNHKDKIWILQLNREIAKRAFGYKKTIGAWKEEW